MPAFKMYFLSSQKCKYCNLLLIVNCSIYKSGTDGLRLLSHQCWSTSIHPLVSSIKNSSSFFNKTQAVPIILCCQRHTGIQALRNLSRGFLLENGRLCSAASLRIRNHYGKLQTITVCHTRRSGESFVLLVKRKEHEPLFHFIAVV